MSSLAFSPFAKVVLAIAAFAVPLQAQNVSPYRLKNGDEIKIAGKVSKAKASTFLLDYGQGSITVELDDYDSYEEGFNIIDGDQVIVTGKVDADSGQKRTIEARRVFIPAIDLEIFASATDEEDTASKSFTQSLTDGTEVDLRGIIKNINRKVITIQSSKGRVEVHLGSVKGQERETFYLGQAVRVTGFFKNRLIRKDMIFADSIQSVKREVAKRRP